MIATVDDIRLIKPIAENLNDTKRLAPYISDTEKIDIIDSLGAKLYKAIDTNTQTTLSYENCSGTTITFSAAEYAALLNGGYYDNDNSFCGGLIPAISYLSYARFLPNNSLNVTAFGVVVKQGQLSEPADTKAVMIQADESRKIGRAYLMQVIDFISFKSGRVEGTKKRNQVKFKIIGD